MAKKGGERCENEVLLLCRLEIRIVRKTSLDFFHLV
jgi:hypothetical protein